MFHSLSREHHITGHPDDANLPALPSRPLVPEASDFLEGDASAAEKVEAFLTRALEATGSDADKMTTALVP